MDLSPSQLSTRFEYRSGSVQTIDGALQFLFGNSNRITLMLSPLSAGIFQFTNRDSSQTDDLVFSLSGNSVTVFEYRNYGSFVGQPWWVFQSPFGGFFSWTEIIYRP